MGADDVSDGISGRDLLKIILSHRQNGDFYNNIVANIMGFSTS